MAPSKKLPSTAPFVPCGFCQVSRFEPGRFTVIFYEEGGRVMKKVLKDDWTATPAAINYGDWKGYTVFKLKGDQPEVAPTQLDPKEPVPSREDPRAGSHVISKDPRAGGHVISGDRDQALHSPLRILSRPQPEVFQRGPGELEEMKGLQLLGRQYHGFGGEQPCPEVQCFGQVQDAVQLPGAAQLQSDAQVPGANQALLFGQVPSAGRALQAALPEDPISDFDDSFEVIEDDNLPQPQPALRSFQICGNADEDESTSPAPPPTGEVSRGSRGRETSIEVRVGQRMSTDDGWMDPPGYDHSSKSAPSVMAWKKAKEDLASSAGLKQSPMSRGGALRKPAVDMEEEELARVFDEVVKAHSAKAFDVGAYNSIQVAQAVSAKGLAECQLWLRSLFPLGDGMPKAIRLQWQALRFTEYNGTDMKHSVWAGIPMILKTPEASKEGAKGSGLAAASSGLKQGQPSPEAAKAKGSPKTRPSRGLKQSFSSPKSVGKGSLKESQPPPSARLPLLRKRALTHKSTLQQQAAEAAEKLATRSPPKEARKRKANQVDKRPATGKKLTKRPAASMEGRGLQHPSRQLQHSTGWKHRARV
eukprot:s1349_g16.t1